MSTTYGATFGEANQLEGIYGYINGGGYTIDEQTTFAKALLYALREEVDARLPDDTTWQPATSEFLHDVGVTLPDAEAMQELFAAAWYAVENRLEQIESLALTGTEAV